MSELPSLAGADWLAAPAVQAVFDLLGRDGGSGRVVGGAVRDALMGRPVEEVDFATTHRPETVMALAEKAGIKAVPTGIEHGTITLIIDGRGYEVTTLREDVETDGRHAVVRFGTDWDADAARRDFTVNALSADAEGRIYDPIGGLPDVIARRIRFIGDPDRRIREDYLRILRFFRFHAECGEGPSDRAGLEAAVRHRNGLRSLAAERINAELGKLLLADRAGETAHEVEEAGLFPIVFAGISHAARLERAIALEQEGGVAPSYPRRLAVLSVMIAEDADRVADRLKLSNADRQVLETSVERSAGWTEMPGIREAKETIYRSGREAFIDAFVFAASRGRGAVADWAKSLQSLVSWEVPTFPLAGRDLLSLGMVRGPEIGALLKRLEKWWIAEGFSPDRAALLGRLQQIGASQQ